MKTTWIFPGGSARAVYTGGVLKALCEMDIPKPDMVFGCSGSAGTCLCYVSGQKEIIEDVWCKELSSRKFLSFWRFWKILNVDYLVDIVLKQRHPLDMEKIKNSPITVYLTVTDSKSGEVKYISNRDNFDLYEVLRATVSVPFWTNLFSIKGVRLGGRFYADSPPAARYQLHIKKAIQEGAERIIIFDNWHNHDNPTGYLFSKIFSYLRGGEYKRRQLAYFKEIENFVMPENVEVVHIAPEERLGMSRFNSENENAKSVFQRGYQEALRNPSIRNMVRQNGME